MRMQSILNGRCLATAFQRQDAKALGRKGFLVCLSMKSLSSWVKLSLGGAGTCWLVRPAVGLAHDAPSKCCLSSELYALVHS